MNLGKAIKNNRNYKEQKAASDEQFSNPIDSFRHAANAADMAGAGPTIMKATGQDRSKQQAASKKAAQNRTSEYNETSGVLGNMEKSDTDYYRNMRTNMKDYQAQRDSSVSDYLSRLGGLEEEATNQGKSAEETYTNTIAPRLKSIMEEAGNQASQAMSLQEAGDPNNKVQQAVRGMYDTQVQGVRKQSLADVGVLNALGSQATANTMGSGMPMTGSQAQLLNSSNMQQSGAAYARAQGQMQSLREQGINRGFDESNNQYNRGVAAKDRYSRTVGDIQNAQGTDISQQQGIRSERGGYDSSRMGVQTGVARENYGMNSNLSGLQHGLQSGQDLRNIASIDQKYGGKNATIADQIAQANADNSARSSMYGGLIQGAGTAIGSYYGGPAGGAAGNAIGGGVNQGMQGGSQSPQPQQGQQQGNAYQSGYNQRNQNPYNQQYGGSYYG